LDKVGDINFETIFVTAYNNYAIDALNAHASYYLMKPISIDELIKAVDYVTEIRTKEDALQDQILVPKTNSVSGKITIPHLDGFEIIETANIMYCKADDNYTEIYLNDNKKKLVSKTLKYIEESLKDANFARVHKSYLVNVDEIVKYVKGKGGSVVLSNGKEVMVSASKKSDLLSYFK
jgi:two-component system LytT family response regulator